MTDAIATITVTNEQLALIRQTIARDATPAELELFLYDCRRRGVHPLDRMIHFTKRGGRYTPITSIDFMRAQAAETGEMAGSDDAVFETDDDGKVLAAKVTVYRLTKDQRFAYGATARWGEYYPGEQQGHMWRKMPHTMLGKCAEALALRKAFPKQLQGLYAREEMAQAGPEDAGARNDQPIPPVAGYDAHRATVYTARDDIAAEQAAIEARDRSLPAEILFPQEEEERERGALIVEASRLAKKLNMAAKDRITALTTYGGKGATPQNIDLAALTELVNFLRARAGEPKWGAAA